MGMCGSCPGPDNGCWAPECYQKYTGLDERQTQLAQTEQPYLPNLHLLPGLSPAQQHLAQALDDLYVHLTHEVDVQGVAAKVTNIR